MIDTVHDVIVVGGGFTGAALACALADRRRRILVIEARERPSARFAGELLHPTAVDELDRLGLLGAIRDGGAAEVDGFAVFPPHGGAATRLGYAAARDGHPFGIGMEHARLVETMTAVAEARPGVRFARGRRVIAVERSRGGHVDGVRLADGAVLRAPLVLVADGRHSRLRPTLGIESRARLVSFTAALRVPDAPLPHPRHGHIFLGGWGPILAYPIGGDVARLCFDVPLGTRLEGLADRLRVEYVPLLPAPLRASVAAALDKEPLELVANHAMRSTSLAAPGVALVGDAGGCAHPLTAAGMTVCLHDVRALADALDGGDLDGYVRSHRAFARSRALLTTSLYRVFRGADPIARRLRDGVFRYWAEPRARAASTALLTGDDPSLYGFGRELLKVALTSLRRSDKMAQ